jgi:hypothetical protein
MSNNLGEIIKKLISVFGRKPARGLPKPPTHHTASGFGGLYMWRKHQNGLRNAESTRRIDMRRKGKGGKIPHFFNNLITK